MATAKYQLIADDLRRLIDTEELAVGSRLASQQSLASDYGVTVMTLRQALAELEREGLVRTVHGAGTFVATPPTISVGLDRLSSFTREMKQQGLAVTTEVLGVHEGWDEALPRSDRVALSGPDGDVAAVVTIVRRRSVDGRPIVLQRSALSAAHWHTLTDVDLTESSLYDTLAERAGLAVARANETFRAVALGAPDAELLETPVGTPCLESTRVSFTHDDHAFLIDRALLLGSASEVRVERSAGDLRLGYTTT